MRPMNRNGHPITCLRKPLHHCFSPVPCSAAATQRAVEDQCFWRWRNPHQNRNMFLLWDLWIRMVIPFLDMGSHLSKPSLLTLTLLYSSQAEGMGVEPFASFILYWLHKSRNMTTTSIKMSHDMIVFLSWCRLRHLKEIHCFSPSTCSAVAKQRAVVNQCFLGGGIHTKIGTCSYYETYE
jgi:hypothetical protein